MAVDVLQLVQAGLHAHDLVAGVALGDSLAEDGEVLVAVHVLHQGGGHGLVGQVLGGLVHQGHVHDHGHVGEHPIRVRGGRGGRGGRHAVGGVDLQHDRLQVPDKLHEGFLDQRFVAVLVFMVPGPVVPGPVFEEKVECFV